MHLLPVIRIVEKAPGINDQIVLKRYGLAERGHFASHLALQPANNGALTFMTLRMRLKWRAWA